MAGWTRTAVVVVCVAAGAAACGEGTSAPDRSQTAADTPAIDRAVVGTLPDGATVERFTLRNENGVEVELATLGAAIHAIHTPDRAGQVADIVLDRKSVV